MPLGLSLMCVSLGCVKKTAGFTNPEVAGLLSYTNMCCVT